MDDFSKDLVKASAEGSTEAALKTIFGPAVELTAWGADIIRRRRFETQIKTMVRAKELLDEAGLSVALVPDIKTLVPLIERAGLEDDPTLQERWAALLANATSGSAEVLPGFSSVLGEITVIEARILELLNDPPVRSRLRSDVRKATGFKTPPEVAQFEVYIANLRRLGLCVVDEPDWRTQQLVDEINGELSDIGSELSNAERAAFYSGSVNYNDSTVSIRLTPFGEQFMRAVTPPSPEST